MDTKTMSNDSEIHLLVGPYAIDALDSIERARFERHLPTCEVCRDEAAELLATAAKLGEAEFVPAPRAMRGAVMARIAVTAQVVPKVESAQVDEMQAEASRASESRAAETQTQPEAEPDTKTVTRLPRNTRTPASRTSRTVRWLSAAAAVLAIGAIGAGTFAYQERQTAETLTAQSQMVADLMASPDTIVRKMPMGNASSAVVMSPSRGEAVMVAQGVPALAADQTYELWTLTADGDARPAGTWQPNANGIATVPLTGDLGGTTAVAVTIEPAGGSATPSGDPIAKVVMA